MHRKTASKLLFASLGLTVLLTACNNDNGNSSSSPNSATDSAAPAKKVTLRFFSNLPDRKAGQGLAEQTIINNYMKENPNVTIEVEALGEPFSNKLRTYMASNEPIDITAVFGGAELNALRQAGYVKELNPKDYNNDNFGFLPGSLKNFTYESKLYGLPRSSDYEVIYYNKKLFEDNGVKIPTTTDELIATAKEFRKKNIAPMSMNGKDQWNLAELYQNVVQRVNGDQQAILDAVDGKKSLKDDPSFLEGAKIFKQFRDAGLFQDGFMTADYGMSQNLFTQGKAAMWYMGSWESGMATNASLPEEFRNNLDVIKFPVVSGGKGKDTDLQAWNGGGVSLVSASPHPEEAKKFFDYMMGAGQWPKVSWQVGGLVPAQKYELAGNESKVQKQMSDILTSATSTPGISWIDHGTPSLKNDIQNVFGEFFSASSSPEQLVDRLQAAIDKQSK